MNFSLKYTVFKSNSVPCRYPFRAEVSFKFACQPTQNKTAKQLLLASTYFSSNLKKKRFLNTCKNKFAVLKMNVLIIDMRNK